MTLFFEDCPSQVLKMHKDLLINLSILFEEGGEKLPKTLDPFVKSCTSFADHYKLDELLLSIETMAQCSKADEDSYLIMCYEFNRLFVGPTSPVAPPYESVYLSPDHLMMGEQALAVRKFYSQINLKATGQGHEPDDFIATELEFAAYLLSRIMDAQDTKSDTQIQLYKKLYQQFWAQHLSLWLGLFAQRVRQSAHHSLFSALSQVLETLTTLHAY